MIISDVLVELADFKNKKIKILKAFKQKENHLQSQKNKLSDFKKKIRLLKKQQTEQGNTGAAFSKISRKERVNLEFYNQANFPLSVKAIEQQFQDIRTQGIPYP